MSRLSFLCSAALILLFPGSLRAQEVEINLAGATPERVATLAKTARSLPLSPEARKKLATRIQHYLQTESAKRLGVSEEKLRDAFKDADALKRLGLQSHRGLGSAFSEWSNLVRYIDAEGALKDCKDRRNASEDVLKALDSRPFCEENQHIAGYHVWQKKEDGSTVPTKVTVPSFALTSNVDQLLALSTRLSLEDSGVNLDKLRADNPKVKDEKEIAQLAARASFRRVAYLRALNRTLKTELALQVAYADSPMASKDIRAAAEAKAAEFCPTCSVRERTSLVNTSMNATSSDIQSGELRWHSGEQISQSLCTKLKGAGYDFRPLSLSMRELRPSSYFGGMGKAKRERYWKDRVRVLQSLVGEGRESLLFLTDALVSDHDDNPAIVNLKCPLPEYPQDHALNVPVIRAAVNEAHDKTREYVQKLNEKLGLSNYKESRIAEDTKGLLDTNPAAVGEALAEERGMAGWVCQGIRGLESERKWQDFKDGAIIWGTAVAGVALTATGVFAGVGTTMTITALAAGGLAVGAGAYSMHRANEAQELSRFYEAAAIAQEGDPKLVAESRAQLEEFETHRMQAIVTWGLAPFEFLGAATAFVRVHGIRVLNQRLATLMKNRIWAERFARASAAEKSALVESALGQSLPIERRLTELSVVSRKPIGVGKNGAEFAELTDGTRAIMKGGDHADAIRMVHAEVAASRLDEVAELGLVPRTVKRDIDGKPYSLQEEITGAKHFDAPDSSSKLGNDEVTFLDYIMGHRDRINENLLVRDGKQFAIDNERAFLLEGFQNQKLPKGQVGIWLKNPKVSRALEVLDEARIRQALDGLIEPRVIEEVIKRVKYLQRMKANSLPKMAA